MKKLTVSILALLYLLVTCGVSVNSHYCMGHFRGAYVGYEQKDICKDCGMAVKKSTCCHDQAHWFKVNDNHHASGIQVAFLAPVAIYQPLQSYYQDNSCPEILTQSGLLHAPPGDIPPLDRRSMYCVFRI